MRRRTLVRVRVSEIAALAGLLENSAAIERVRDEDVVELWVSERLFLQCPRQRGMARSLHDLGQDGGLGSREEGAMSDHHSWAPLPFAALPEHLGLALRFPYAERVMAGGGPEIRTCIHEYPLAAFCADCAAFFCSMPVADVKELVSHLPGNSRRRSNER